MRVSRVISFCICLAAAVGLCPSTALLPAEECGGECSGNFSDDGIYPNQCPSPCPTAATVTAFQYRARQAADYLCFLVSEDPDCRCAGGTYSTEYSFCQSVYDPQSNTWVCEWSLSVWYKAEAPAGCHEDP